MKQQTSIGHLEEPDFGMSTPMVDPQALLNKFNNTVVLKKGQMTQVLKGNGPTAIIVNNKDQSPTRGGGNGSVPRRNSRNNNAQRSNPHNATSGNIGGLTVAAVNSSGTVKDNNGHYAHQQLGGPETANNDSNDNLQLSASKGAMLEHYHHQQQQQMQQLMNQTLRSSHQQQQNLAAVINNIKNNGSLRNLQNFRSKRMEKVQQQYVVEMANGVRVPPIQNGLYFSNIIQNANGGAQSQRYQQANNNNNAAMIISPRQQNNSKSNGGVVGHQKTQSMGDVSGIIKSIITQGGATQMPNIMVASPRNAGGIPASGVSGNGVSIERINKNISDSIKAANPHNKEIQLIQAYQHQKWKEQITQRKNKNVALRSLDTTYDQQQPQQQQPQYVLNTSREPKQPPMIVAQSINTSSIVGIATKQQQAAAQGRPRMIQATTNNNGSLTSRFPAQQQQQQSPTYPQEAGVFAYHDQSTYSSTMDDESRMMKTQIKFPMSSQEAFKLLQPLLWDVEKTELLEFETVYFFNVVERKKQSSEQRRTQASGGSSSTMMVMGSDNPKLINFGFDNESQEYNVVMHEHLAFRYEVVKKLGKGSFGIVLRVFDHKTKEFLALKILKNKKRLYKQGLVEAKLIENLNKADPEDKKNIIRKLEQFVFRKHLMITFEMLSINLYEFIKMNNFQGFSLNLIKRFAIQILIALFFMKEHNIVHCDMKPENILLRKINKSGIKIIDFGSGCFENEKIYTYIQSRFYRAPEIVLGIQYTTAIDMWSYGCILYELFVGYPLFPGEDEKEHMAMIMEVKGVPPRSVLARATRRKVFFDDDYQPILVANSRGKIRNPNTKNLAALMNCPDRDFVDFVDKCIEWKVENRLTPEQAFSHPFIAKAVQELKGIRGGQSETTTTQQPQSSKQQTGGNNSQQQSAHPSAGASQQPKIVGGGVSDILNAASSNSEAMLPQINFKQ